MVAAKEEGQSEIVVRIWAKNGTDTITVGEVEKILSDKFYCRNVEGNSIETEALAIACREVIKKHVVEPLSDIPLKMVKDINDAWQAVKEPVEKLLQHRFAQCPGCGAAALSDAMHEGTRFICPVCETVLKWVFKADIKHPNGGRYTLEK